jgi:23S rRNA pseudouridine2605 synthase
MTMPQVDDETLEGVRLQKVLAQAGVGSRRTCEELIAQGRVEVDGRIVRTQGLRVDPARAVIRVDGSRVLPEVRQVYLAVNKPRGMVSTMSDPQGRPALGDLVEDFSQRLFHVGRLDADSEGLIFLMNDGDLAHRLAHPSHEVAKTYIAEVAGPIPRDLGRRLKAGVGLEDGPVRVDEFSVKGRSANRVILEITLHEGRNHIVRRMLAEVGHPVLRLVRTQIGPIRLGELRPGRTRRLTADEVAKLYDAVGL